MARNPPLLECVWGGLSRFSILRPPSLLSLVSYSRGATRASPPLSSCFQQRFVFVSCLLAPLPSRSYGVSCRAHSRNIRGNLIVRCRPQQSLPFLCYWNHMDTPHPCLRVRTGTWAGTAARARTQAGTVAHARTQPGSQGKPTWQTKALLAF